MKWKPLPIPTNDEQAYKDSVRLNSLGSLFFFAHHVLKKNRLQKLHYEMCRSLETDDLHLVLEMPMGFFKTTVGTEALSMWWSLPFTARDEFMMRKLGYDDAWIAWMKSAHDPNSRTLVTHETEARACAMGKAIDDHYLNNDLFRFVFSDIIPDNSCTWNDHTKFHKRHAGSKDLTTGTFEYRGAGQALQGIHVTGVINDDSIGRAAQDNMLRGDGSIVEGIYRWWKQIHTRFDSAYFTKSGMGRHLVIGNRWGHADLNSLIAKNHKEFKIETHSAEGGCCKRHPAGQSIFPEEWSMERLANERATLSAGQNGSYDYAHFMLNQSVMPEECIFKKEWLRYFLFKKSRPDLSDDDVRNYVCVETLNDARNMPVTSVGSFHRRMIIDLAHAKKRKRCNHVILVVGWEPETDRIILLEAWAEPSSYSDLVENIYKIGHRWGMRDMWLETVAAQNLLKFYLDERNMKEKRPIFVNELPYDNSENAKKNRIELLQPLFKNGQIWCHSSQKAFLSEYESYPAGLVDVLDCLGYVPQILTGIHGADVGGWLSQQQQEFAGRSVGAGGY